MSSLQLPVYYTRFSEFVENVRKVSQELPYVVDQLDADERELVHCALKIFREGSYTIAREGSLLQSANDYKNFVKLGGLEKLKEVESYLTGHEGKAIVEKTSVLRRAIPSSVIKEEFEAAWKERGQALSHVDAKEYAKNILAFVNNSDLSVQVKIQDHLLNRAGRGVVEKMLNSTPSLSIPLTDVEKEWLEEIKQLKADTKEVGVFGRILLRIKNYFNSDLISALRAFSSESSKLQMGEPSDENWAVEALIDASDSVTSSKGLIDLFVSMKLKLVDPSTFKDDLTVYINSPDKEESDFEELEKVIAEGKRLDALYLDTDLDVDSGYIFSELHEKIERFKKCELYKKWLSYWEWKTFERVSKISQVLENTKFNSVESFEGIKNLINEPLLMPGRSDFSKYRADVLPSIYSFYKNSTLISRDDYIRWPDKDAAKRTEIEFFGHCKKEIDFFTSRLIKKFDGESVDQPPGDPDLLIQFFDENEIFRSHFISFRFSEHNLKELIDQKEKTGSVPQNINRKIEDAKLFNEEALKKYEKDLSELSGLIDQIEKT